VLGARVWSGLGMLESVIAGVSGFRICSSFFFFHLGSCAQGRKGSGCEPVSRTVGRSAKTLSLEGVRVGLCECSLKRGCAIR